jgi:hypothetical protein
VLAAFAAQWVIFSGEGMEYTGILSLVLGGIYGLKVLLYDSSFKKLMKSVMEILRRKAQA